MDRGTNFVSSHIRPRDGGTNFVQGQIGLGGPGTIEGGETNFLAVLIGASRGDTNCLFFLPRGRWEGQFVSK